MRQDTTALTAESTMEKVTRSQLKTSVQHGWICHPYHAKDASQRNLLDHLGGVSSPLHVMIGPEGGFSESELSRLRGLEYVHPVSLGPRILRADTAAVAAMTVWQDALGDW